MAIYKKSCFATVARRIKVVFIPKGLAPSARVDLLHLAIDVRPAIRIIPRNVQPKVLARWAAAHGWYAASDEEGFLAISRSPALSRKILKIDCRAQPHTRELGMALGYPPCCCAAAARRGESAIDQWASEAASRFHLGVFRLIDAAGYRVGRSLLSHIPCTVRCRRSLAMAKQISAAHARVRRLGSRCLLAVAR